MRGWPPQDCASYHPARHCGRAAQRAPGNDEKADLVALTPGRSEWASTVHVAGGGALNVLLRQAIADCSGLTVVTGPVEATAMGSLLVQAWPAGQVRGGLRDLRVSPRVCQRLGTNASTVAGTLMPAVLA
nr:FGGY-family carbohydrate kinase [Streptomyces sp. NP160]